MSDEPTPSQVAALPLSSRLGLAAAQLLIHRATEGPHADTFLLLNQLGLIFANAPELDRTLTETMARDLASGDVQVAMEMARQIVEAAR